MLNSKKRRANFSSLLQGKKTVYFLCEDAFEYMLTRKLPALQIEKLKALTELEYSDEYSWQELLESIAITSIRHVRRATEEPLMGALLKDNNLDHLAITVMAQGNSIYFSMACAGYMQSVLSIL
jgi:hypothetical protein